MASPPGTPLTPGRTLHSQKEFLRFWDGIELGVIRISGAQARPTRNQNGLERRSQELGRWGSGAQRRASGWQAQGGGCLLAYQMCFHTICNPIGFTGASQLNISPILYPHITSPRCKDNTLSLSLSLSLSLIHTHVHRSVQSALIMIQ